MADMNQWAELVRVELARLINDHPSTVIYHYTDVAGLIGIITSGCIWATHVGKLNDASENRYGHELVVNHVRANLPNSTKQLIEKALSTFRSVDTYVACYSTERNLLSQWRNYTGDRVGYSLGFETGQMATVDDRMPILEQVIYRDDIAKSVLDFLLGKVDEYFGCHSFGEVEVGYVSGMVAATLNSVACILKHEGFKEEHEYRQIYQPGRTELVLNTEFRHGQFGLTPFVKIEFLEKNRLPLRTITVGPCRDPEAEFNALKVLLSRNGYEKVQVLESGIPLRM
ncbi:MAG: DUF2971 domain-containing protein [Sulfuritalea sp.]|nr:DUF2971 domain-containing protein [Sulfuritalea sp.]